MFKEIKRKNEWINLSKLWDDVEFYIPTVYCNPISVDRITETVSSEVPFWVKAKDGTYRVFLLQQREKLDNIKKELQRITQNI